MKYLGAKSNDGYHNQKTGFCSYFLTFEDGARIEIMNIPEMADLPKKIVRTGYSHIAFSVGSIEIVDALTAELKADGYEILDDETMVEFYTNSAGETVYYSEHYDLPVQEN